MKTARCESSIVRAAAILLVVVCSLCPGFSEAHYYDDYPRHQSATKQMHDGNSATLFSISQLNTSEVRELYEKAKEYIVATV